MEFSDAIESTESVDLTDSTEFDVLMEISYAIGSGESIELTDSNESEIP